MKSAQYCSPFRYGIGYRRTIQFFEIADKLKAQVQKLKVLSADQLRVEQFLQIWNGEQANRLSAISNPMNPPPIMAA